MFLRVGGSLTEYQQNRKDRFAELVSGLLAMLCATTDVVRPEAYQLPQQGQYVLEATQCDWNLAYSGSRCSIGKPLKSIC